MFPRAGGEALNTEDRRARLERLYRGHADRVLSYALRRVGRDQAQEVMAETFITAVRLPNPLTWPLDRWKIRP